MQLYKLPAECSIKELEQFVTNHNIQLPKNTNAVVYRQVLQRLSTGILDSLGRSKIEIISNSLTQKVKKKIGKFLRKTDQSDALHLETSPKIDISSPIPYPDSLYKITQKLSLSDSFTDEQPIYQNVNRINIENQPIRVQEQPMPSLERDNFSEFSEPPPLPPKLTPRRFYNRPTFETDFSIIEHGRLTPNDEPEQKRVKRKHTLVNSTRVNHDHEMPSNHPKFQSTPGQIPKPQVFERSGNFSTNKPLFNTKFLQKFNEKENDIEAYLMALNRWKRLNHVPDGPAISVGLANFSNIDLANYTEAGLTPQAFEDFTLFETEVKKLLGKTTNQWFDLFDTVKRKPSETCFTFYSRLQSILKSALKITQFLPEHERLIMRKFYKSVHPTLRGHLELREPEPTFSELPFLANKIELALSIEKGATVELNHIASAETQKPLKQSERSKNDSHPRDSKGRGVWTDRFCELCKGKNHTIDFCFGNPMGRNFDMHKFSKMHNLNSKNL